MNIYAKLAPEQKQAACIDPRRAPARQPAWNMFVPGKREGQRAFWIFSGKIKSKS
jgi:hypothetical protein